MRARAWLGILVLALGTSAWLCAVGAGRAHGQRPDDVGGFMRLKLTHAQQVLEGLSLEDFDMVAKHSQAMALLTQDENWLVYQTPQYRQHSADFQRVCDTLTKQAKEKNLDGATLAYMQLTMSCVECHKYTRGVRMAGILPELRAPVILGSVKH